MSITNDFTEFLKITNCYNSYMDQFFIYYGSYVFSNYMARTPKQDYFRRAFKWENTVEGFWYWYRLSQKWENKEPEYLQFDMKISLN